MHHRILKQTRFGIYGALVFTVSYWTPLNFQMEVSRLGKPLFNVMMIYHIIEAIGQIPLTVDIGNHSKVWASAIGINNN